MKKALSIFFSMSAMGVFLLVFAVAIASATFVENDFGSSAAKAVVYNAVWFDVLLALLAVNLTGIIIRKKLYRMKNPGSFIFHASFLVILLGSALTRFIGFEGVMHLREGETSNHIVSDRTYVVVKAVNHDKSVVSMKPVLLSVLTPKAFHEKLHIGNKEIKFRTIQFVEKANSDDVLLVEVNSGDSLKSITLHGGKGIVGKENNFTINGVKLSMRFGARKIELPFAVKLENFQLDRYPGSMSPSGYASQVTVIDNKDKITKPYRIYMNHVLNYKGYRFFQSSYDRDERGSVLSVNHDVWGTFFTYLGYFLMALGMMWSLLNRKSRFAELGRALKAWNQQTKAGVIALIVFMVLGSTSGLYAQHKHMDLGVDKVPVVNKMQAENFGKLIVQSNDGRLKPINTLSSQLLRKITGKSNLHGLNADQALLGMLSNSMYWQLVPVIKVDDKNIAKILDVKGKKASYIDFFDTRMGTYKLQSLVSEVYEKKPSQRNRQDKKAIKIDERVNILYMIFSGNILKLFPDTRSSDLSWLTLGTKQKTLTSADSLMIKGTFPQFLEAVAVGDAAKSDSLLEKIASFQNKYAAPIIPSSQKISTEILYNKLMIFDRLGLFYGIIGILMIVLIFIDILGSSKYIKAPLKVLMWAVVLGFVVQTVGLGLRWYIAGHAPWSDGYESMIYIAWVTLLAGLLFSKRSIMTIAATTVLSAIILLVAHLSWMDPEITNLVPVLKSYWLTIHVSVITASYGFLALSALLGFFNLILMMVQSPGNTSAIRSRIGELTIINERSLIVGLYMLTIGTFLGGVWANESWGRYWGWDPKETWALVSVLVYSFIAHMHNIPGLKSKFSFNLASLLGYFVILMTFFGVNYYLSGLHSYAKGDAMPIPAFTYYVVGLIVVVAVWAWVKEQQYKNG